MDNNQNHSNNKWLYTLVAILGLVVVLFVVNGLFNKSNNQQTAYNESQAYGAGLGHIQLSGEANNIIHDFPPSASRIDLGFNLVAPQKENVHLQNIVVDTVATIKPDAVKQVCLVDANINAVLSCAYGPLTDKVYLGANGDKIVAGENRAFSLNVDFSPDQLATQSGGLLSLQINSENIFAFEKTGRRVQVSGNFVGATFKVTK